MPKKKKDEFILNIDEDIFNADWSKQTWDLWGVDSLEALVEYLDSTHTSLRVFMELPVYRLNRDKLPWLSKLEDVARERGEL